MGTQIVNLSPIYTIKIFNLIPVHGHSTKFSSSNNYYLPTVLVKINFYLMQLKFVTIFPRSKGTFINIII